MKQFHRSRLAILLEAVDELEKENIVIMAETIPCLVEAEALLDILLFENEYPFLLSVSARENQVIASEEPLFDVLVYVNDSVSEAKQKLGFSTLMSIGCNCTAPENVESVLQIMASHNPHGLYLVSADF